MSDRTAVGVLGRSHNGIIRIGGVVCLVVLLTGLLVSPAASWSGLLIAGVFALTVALGASLFAAVNAVTGARWCSTFDLVPAVVGWTLLVPCLALALVFVGGLQVLYPWAQASVVEASHLLQGKVAWLNSPFFLTRAAVLLVAFLALTRMLFRSGGADPTVAPTPKAGVVFVVGFAICISVASWDWLMSLEPEWFSTMYGVYVFSGAFLGGIAAVTLMAVALDRSDPRVHMGEKQLHDIGKLLFGFATFWAYIWFCQYMLIWYANIPEETAYFARRLTNDWTMLFWLNPVLNFIVPFVVLLSVRAKTHPRTIVEVARIVLLGRWLDTYLMVAPSVGGELDVPVFAFAATGLVVLGQITIARRLLRRPPAQSALAA